jgi:hypothetical protein
VLYLPWLMNVPAQYSNIENAYWVARPTLTKTFTLLMVYATNLPVKDGWLPLSLFVSLLVMTLASYQTYLAFRKRLSEARRGLWLAYLTFAPPALVFLVSQWRPVYVERAFVASGSMFWLWLAWALTATGLPRLLKTVTLILLMAGITLGLVSHVTYSGPPYGPFKELDNFLTSRIEAGDVIVHSNKMSFMPAVYFNRTLKQQFIGDPQGGVDDTLAPATQQVLGIEETPSLEIATSGAKRVWFITSKNGLDLQADLDWLDNHSRLVSKETWGPILLYLYTQQGK